MTQEAQAFDAIVLVGHGAAARDTPRDLVRRLRALEGERHRTGGPMTDEEARLDREVRSWPRTKENDPYKAGVDALAERLRAIAAPARVVVAFNEFCAPTIAEAVEALAAEGARAIVLVTTMTTQGGVHAEEEIPAEVAALQQRHPELSLRYAWPFDLEAVARLILDQAVGIART